MRNKIKLTMKGPKPFVLGLIFLLGLLYGVPAFAAGTLDKANVDLMGIVTGILLLAGWGVGLGAFGFMVNHIFHRRSTISYRVMCMKPGLSFLIGIIITIVTLGLILLFQAVEFIQGIIMLAYLIGLGLFATGPASRLVARLVEPPLSDDDLPSAGAHIKGGLILLFINAILLIGNIFFIGIILASIGATLLGYFASMGGAVAAITPPVEEKQSPHTEG